VEPVPPGVHYDLWLGPAPRHEYTANRLHYNWHWFWDYGNGDLGNQGIHQLDMARWGLGVKYPTKVSAIGGHFMFDDDQETPNTLTATFEFEQGGARKIIVFEVRHWISNHEAGIGEPKPGNSVGTTFYGPKGYLSMWDEDSHKYSSWLGREQAPGPGSSDAALMGNHWANFIDAVRSRKGRTLHFDAASYSCPGDAEANRMFTREYRKPFVVPEKV
jgi:predicted dehydrogenase